MSSSYRNSNPKTQPWWKSEKNDAHGAVFAHVEWLEERQAVRHAANLHHLRLYSNRMASALSGQSYADAADTGERIRLNICKSATDAAVAQIATNRPRPLFLTENGNYELRKRAEKLGRFVMGQFYALQMYIQALDVFRDGAVFGTGWWNTYHEGGRICGERVLDDEVIVDEDESLLGKPRMLFRRKNDANRYTLAARFPEHAEAIMASKRLDDFRATSSYEGTPDTTTVVEGWILPSSPGAKDGRHVICVSGATLLDEVWKRTTFPLTPFRWSPAPVGFRGIGAVEELSPIQVEINYIAQKIQKLMTLATSMVWKEKGSFMGKLDNQDWAVREYTGKPPLFQTTAAVSAEYFHHLDRLYQRGYEIVGISQLSATSQKPAGLDSGEALRTYNDIGTRRFQHVGQRWEQFFLDVTEQILECAREIQEDGDKLTVLAQGDKDVESLDFSEVSIEKNKYVMKVHPVSIIPDTPAGKIEMMTKLSQIAPNLGSRLVQLLSGIPDLESALRLENAPLELAEYLVNNILEHGRYEPAPPYANLELTRDVATRNLLRAQIEGVPEERQEMLRRFVDQIDALQELQQPKMGMPPMGPDGMPLPGAPMAGPMPGAPAAAMPPQQAPLMPAPPPGMPMPLA